MRIGHSLSIVIMLLAPTVCLAQQYLVFGQNAGPNIGWGPCPHDKSYIPVGQVCAVLNKLDQDTDFQAVRKELGSLRQEVLSTLSQISTKPSSDVALQDKVSALDKRLSDLEKIFETNSDAAVRDAISKLQQRVTDLEKRAK